MERSIRRLSRGGNGGACDAAGAGDRSAPETDFRRRLVPELAYRPLSEMVKLPIVAKHLEPLLERHRKSIEILRERSEARDGVIFFDVGDLDLEATTNSFRICCTRKAFIP